MFKNIIVLRPIAVIDLETTGTDVKLDRIVELSVCKILAAADGDGRPLPNPLHVTRRFHPGVPIPAAASAIHGIHDGDVADAPPFRAAARSLLELLDGCDLCGFNILKFDIKMLYYEFHRAGLEFDLDGRRIVDPMVLYHRMEPRNLSAAVRFYCGRDHDGAHGASADVLAAIEVLDAQVTRYELPDVHGPTFDELHDLLRDADALDIEGKFRNVDGEAVFTFGKYSGRPLASIAESDGGYLRWFMASDFLPDAKKLVYEAQGRVEY